MHEQNTNLTLIKRFRRRTIHDPTHLQEVLDQYQEDLRTELDPDIAYRHRLKVERYSQDVAEVLKQSTKLFSKLRGKQGFLSPKLLRVNISSDYDYYKTESAACKQEREAFATIQLRPSKALVTKCYGQYFPSTTGSLTFQMDEGVNKFQVETGIPLSCSPFDSNKTDNAHKLFFASCRSQGNDVQIAVVKRIPLPKDANQRSVVYKEVNNLKYISEQGCSTFLRYIGSEIIRASDPSQCSILYLVTEYIEGCSLARRIQVQQEPLSEQFVLHIAEKVISALEFIHSRGIIWHRNINPKNILLDSSLEVKIINLDVNDGGCPWSRLLCTPIDPIGHNFHDLTDELRDAIQHGCDFWPPELIARGDLSYSGDIWGFGCTALYLLTGPWSLSQGLEMFNYQRGSGLEPSTINRVDDRHFLLDVLKPAMRPNPTMRPTAEELCRRSGEMLQSHFSDAGSTVDSH